MGRSDATINTSSPRYTPQQLHEVYNRVDLPTRYRYEPGEFSKEVIRHHDGIGFLSALQRHMLANVPFENLELHYSPHHQVSLNADALFNKIVRQRAGRGGHCLELNVFMATILQSLGFDVMSVGARLNLQHRPDNDMQDGEERYGGWSHMINIVNVRGDLYVVDVGYGAGGPTHPLPLKEGDTSKHAMPSQGFRLRKGSIPQAKRETDGLWVLERRNAEKDPWTAVYCFEDRVCFLPQDFEVMNHFTNTHRTSVFTYRIMASRYLLDRSGEEVVGEVIMFEDKVSRTEAGQEPIVAQLRTEHERALALQKHLGITLSEMQKDGIKGMVTQLLLE